MGYGVGAPRSRRMGHHLNDSRKSRLWITTDLLMPAQMPTANMITQLSGRRRQKRATSEQRVAHTIYQNEERNPSREYQTGLKMEIAVKAFRSDVPAAATATAAAPRQKALLRTCRQSIR